MKQVIKNSNVVSLDNVDSDKYYGFLINKGSPGYIAADDMVYNKRTYRARFFSYMTEGNPWGEKNHDTLGECITSMLENNSNCEVFEFDSYQELLKWGSEQ